MDESLEPEEIFTSEYAAMSEKELIKLACEFDDLVEPAQQALRDELKKRRLEMPKQLPPSNYGQISNSQLLKIAAGYDKLPEATQAALREEFAARGLEPPIVEDDAAEEEKTPLLQEPMSELITVRSFRDLSTAYVARAVLEEAGIPCILRDENMVRQDWFLSNALGGARLQVPANYAAAADERLSQPMPASFEDGMGEVFVQPVCPKCGSNDVVEDDMNHKIKTASAMGFPLGAAALTTLPFTGNADWKCNQCGCRWADDGEPDFPSETVPAPPLR